MYLWQAHAVLTMMYDEGIDSADDSVGELADRAAILADELEQLIFDTWPDEHAEQITARSIEQTQFQPDAFDKYSEYSAARDACALCEMDVEYWGADGWVGRGGDRFCDESGAARYDENGVKVPFPHIAHKPMERV